MQDIYAASIARTIEPRAVARLICQDVKPWSGVIYDRLADGRVLRVTCRRGNPVKFTVKPAPTPSPAPTAVRQ